MKEKGVMYYRKVKGELDEEGGRRLVKVGRKVNGMRRKLKRLYFDRRLGEIARGGS